MLICVRPFEMLCDQDTKLKCDAVIYQVGLLSLATYHGITTLCSVRSPLKIPCSLYQLVNVPTTSVFNCDFDNKKSLVLTCEMSTGISTKDFKDVHISDIRVRSVSHVRDILVYD